MKKLLNQNKKRKKENELRQKIIEILKAIKEPEERILDVHGSNEYGLDIVLIKLDPFGQLRAYGVQIKNGDIKCTGKPSLKIKEIIGQLAIAFGDDCEVDGKKYRYDGFYVVTNGEISWQAKKYIDSACVGIRNLHFIDKHAFEEFINKNKPKAEKLKET